MTSQRAPKQLSLTSNETITSLEAWENNLKYILSLDSNFADFLTDGTSWGKKTNASPLRGFSNDNESVPAPRRRTAAQKVTHLEMMLGQIANYAPIISRNSIVKNSFLLMASGKLFGNIMACSPLDLVSWILRIFLSNRNNVLRIYSKA